MAIRTRWKTEDAFLGRGGLSSDVAAAPSPCSSSLQRSWMSLKEAECVKEWFLRLDFPHHIRNKTRRLIGESEKREERGGEFCVCSVCWVDLVLSRRKEGFGGTTATAKEVVGVGVAALHVCVFFRLLGLSPSFFSGERERGKRGKKKRGG